MKKSLRRLGGVLVLVVAGLWSIFLLTSRDAPPPDETEFRAERPAVAPEDNAFTYFLEATNRLVESTNPELLIKYRSALPVDEGAVRELVEENADCLALVKRGTECAICLTPPVETIGTPTPYVNPWLHMSRVLSVRTQMALREGRHAAAADDVIVGLRFGDLVQKDASSLITYLVGVAIFSSSAEQALELARDPAAPPEALERLAAELEKIGPFDGGLARAFRAEYRIECNVVDGLRNQRKQTDPVEHDDFEDGRRLVSRLRFSRYYFKPNQTKWDLAKAHRRLIGNASLTYADMVWADYDAYEMGRLSCLWPNAVGRILFKMLMPALDKVIRTKCGMDGVLAGVRLAVACHRFERERGRFPETLQELVPDFLAEVPRDPYDGNPFRYSAEKGLVWAVGTNLTDEGGSTRVPGAEESIPTNRDRRRAEDFVFELRAAEKAK